MHGLRGSFNGSIGFSLEFRVVISGVISRVTKEQPI